MTPIAVAPRPGRSKPGPSDGSGLIAEQVVRYEPFLAATEVP